MIDDILVAGVPGGFEWLVIVIVLGIPVLLIVLFVRYLSRSSKERQKMRIELGKLADELEQVRKQAKQGEKRDSSLRSE